MALLTAASFPNITAPAPTQSGTTVTVANPTDAVTITTSTGTYTVFDSVSTGLLCLEFLRQNSGYYLSLANNISVFAVGYTKLLIAEMTPSLYRLLNVATPGLYGGELRFQVPGQSSTLTLAAALQAYGVQLTGLVYDNASLIRSGVALRVFDIKYKAGAALSAGSQTSDLAPLVYSYVTSHGV